MSVRTARSAARRLAAIAAALLLLAAGILGLRHEADGAHVRDPRTGAMLHGHALAGTHVASTQPDVHGRADDQDADSGACFLDAVLHQAAAPGAAPVLLAAPARAAPTGSRRAVTHARVLASVLRIAPKTSPPATG